MQIREKTKITNLFMPDMIKLEKNRQSREKFMSKTLIKPRWSTWENQCIQKAFQEKIHLKVISMALGRTTTAVRKKIYELNLRGLTSLQSQSRSSLKPKGVRARIKMEEILSTYAPSKRFQNARKVLKKRRQGYVVQRKESAYTSPFPLEYILSIDHLPKKERSKRVFGDPYYVTLQDMESWALSYGFHPLRGELKHSGVEYWRDGKLFSKAQLLMYVNGIRYERKLQPLALCEDEEEL